MALEGTDPVRELAQRLFDSAQAYADDKHVRYDERASNDLWKCAQQAALDIAKETDARQGERTQEAQRNFETLIDLMIRESNEISGYRVRFPGTIGWQTMSGAIAYLRKNHFCPLWPFC
jgi:hypothetical protein